MKKTMDREPRGAIGPLPSKRGAPFLQAPARVLPRPGIPPGPLGVRGLALDARRAGQALGHCTPAPGRAAELTPTHSATLKFDGAGFDLPGEARCHLFPAAPAAAGAAREVTR